MGHVKILLCRTNQGFNENSSLNWDLYYFNHICYHSSLI